jgi:hypothetical protein
MSAAYYLSPAVSRETGREQQLDPGRYDAETMTTDQPQPEVADTATANREYQLAGFIVGLILGLLVVIPLAWIIIG